MKRGSWPAGWVADGLAAADRRGRSAARASFGRRGRVAGIGTEVGGVSPLTASWHRPGFGRPRAVSRSPGASAGQADAEHLLDGGAGDAQDVAEVDDGEAGAAAGGAPLLGQVVGLRPADSQEPAGFFDGQEGRDAVIHWHNSQTLTSKPVDGITSQRVCDSGDTDRETM